MRDRPSVEETYTRYEFSELVRLGLMAARSILRMLRLAKTPDTRADATPGKVVPAD
jgi:hypothetical protein